MKLGAPGGSSAAAAPMASAGPQGGPGVSISLCSVWQMLSCVDNSIRSLAYHGPGVDYSFSWALEAISQGGHEVSSRCVCWAEPGVGSGGPGWAAFALLISGSETLGNVLTHLLWVLRPVQNSGATGAAAP